MQAYGISGDTVDRAVAVLKDAGIVRTVVGLGIFVIPPGERESPSR
jgi:DNA-binding GntR family transcriptional regulator